MFYAAQKLFQGRCAGKAGALLQGKKVDGLIILGDMTKPYIEQIEKRGGVPVCVMGFFITIFDMISQFLWNYALTNYLFSMGHKNTMWEPLV